MRRRDEEPTRRTRMAQPTTASDQATAPYSQECGAENQRHSPRDPSELHGWVQSHRSRATEARTVPVEGCESAEEKAGYGSRGGGNDTLFFFFYVFFSLFGR